MQVFVNGEARSVAPEASVAMLLEELGLAQLRVAVAVNQSVVPRSRHAAVVLREGDRVEIVHAVQGG